MLLRATCFSSAHASCFLGMLLLVEFTPAVLAAMPMPSGGGFDQAACSPGGPSWLPEEVLVLLQVHKGEVSTADEELGIYHHHHHPQHQYHHHPHHHHHYPHHAKTTTTTTATSTLTCPEKNRSNIWLGLRRSTDVGVSVTTFDVLDANVRPTFSNLHINTKEVVGTGTGLARDPVSGVLYAVVGLGGPSNDEGEDSIRVLATLDVETGALEKIGNLTQFFAAITFDCSGGLYGLAGSAELPGLIPGSLWKIDQETASATFLLNLTVGEGGETLGFNPADGLLYRWYSSPLLMETISLQDKVVTPVNMSGPAPVYASGVGYNGSGLFYMTGEDVNDVFEINTTGFSQLANGSTNSREVTVTGIAPQDARAYELCRSAGLM